MKSFLFPTWLLWWLAGSLQSADTPATAPFSLAKEYPPETLRQILIPAADWKPFPRFQDQLDWQAVPEVARELMRRRGEEARTNTFPSLPATLYLEYARNGNRSHYEDVFFKRRTCLRDLVLAECVEAKGRYLEAIANALWAICEESSWCVPAHVGAQKAGTGLPDVTEPIVDLFAGESGVSVAWTLYLVGGQLDRVSPQVRLRAERELRNRILIPVFERDNFGWMALDVKRPEQRPNNWTPWIAASVLTAALASEPDSEHRVQIVHKMLRSLDGFLRYYPADGGCDEGPGYWGRAGGSLLDCLDLLYSATGGKINIFNQPLIQEIGRFITRAHIAGDYYVPIGDCAARLTPNRDLVFRYGQDIHDADLQGMAAEGASASSVLGDTFGRELFAVFDLKKILALPAHSAPLAGEAWLPSEDMQLLAARSQAGSAAGLYLATWGAHNAQSHNHNDVGNFLVFADGQPVLVDVGAPTYTAQTFSSRRYEIWAFQSAYHNLPTINGVMQSAGRQFAARAVNCVTNARMAELRMDIAPAYPATARMVRWLRTVRLNRGQSIEVTEDFELKEIMGETVENLITPRAVEVATPGRLVFRGTDKSAAKAAPVRLEYDPAKLTATVETIELTDQRLSRSWGKQLRRVQLKANHPQRKDQWTLRLTLEP